jgi:hypothetical protein
MHDACVHHPFMISPQPYLKEFAGLASDLGLGDGSADLEPFENGMPRRTKRGKRKRHENGPLSAQDLVQLIPVAEHSVILEPAPVIWQPMKMSEVDKAPSVVLRPSMSPQGDNITVESRKGYRMVRPLNAQ